MFGSKIERKSERSSRDSSGRNMMTLNLRWRKIKENDRKECRK